MSVGLVEIIIWQKEFSAKTFGAHLQLPGLIKHLKKEIAEIEATSGADLMEWVDLILLAIDGAWRNTGASAEEITAAILRKQSINRGRRWPDMRDVRDGEPAEHIRDGGDRS